jgi:GNAT superfamily N-acetyltransferase
LGLSLREFRPADRPRCREILVAAQPFAHPRQSALDIGLGDFDASTREEEIWVADQDGEIRGWSSLYRPGRFLHHLYVDLAWRGQGIGRALLGRAVARCGGSAELKCDEANRDGQAFYWAAGWRAAGWGWAPSGPWIRLRY